MPKSRKPDRKPKTKKTRFFGKKTAGREHKQFLEKKQKAMEKLKHFMGLTIGAHTIHPPVRNVVVKLNRIPFVYTTGSSSPIIETLFRTKEIAKGIRQKDLTVAQAEKHSVVSFTSAYVDFYVDLSVQQAKEFIASLLNWQKRNFPTSFVNAEALGNKALKIMLNAPLSGRKFPHAEVPGKQAKQLYLESENFMRAFEAFLDNYSKT